MPPLTDHPLIDFLVADLEVPPESIAMGLRRIGTATNLLPMVLWQYGLVSTEELDQIFDWVAIQGITTSPYLQADDTGRLFAPEVLNISIRSSS